MKILIYHSGHNVNKNKCEFFNAIQDINFKMVIKSLGVPTTDILLSQDIESLNAKNLNIIIVNTDTPDYSTLNKICRKITSQTEIKCLFIFKNTFDRVDTKLNKIFNSWGIEINPVLSSYSSLDKTLKFSFVNEMEISNKSIHIVNSLSFKCLDKHINKIIVNDLDGNPVIIRTETNKNVLYFVGTYFSFTDMHIGDGDNFYLLANIVKDLLDIQDESLDKSSFLFSNLSVTQEDDIFTYTVSEDTKKYIIFLYEKYCLGINPYKNSDDFVLNASLAFSELPLEIRKSFREFVIKGNLNGGILLKNLPIDIDLPLTPTSLEEIKYKKSFLNEFIILLD